MNVPPTRMDGYTRPWAPSPGARNPLAALLYRNPIYRALLMARAPQTLALTPPDPWPGSAEAGSLVMRPTFDFAETPGETASPSGHHDFAWLRDLQAVASDAARQRARELVANWIARFGTWSEPAWRTDVTGERVVNWLSRYEFFAASADDGFRRAVLASLARQTAHLARVAGTGPKDARRLLALKGLICGAICLPGQDTRLERALAMLGAELERQVHPDGGHVERSPSQQLAVLRDLVDIRATLVAAQEEVPDILQMTIDRMAPALRAMRHGDGGLALFNGSTEEPAWMVDVVLNQADSRGKPPSSAPHSGFQRIGAGRCIVIMDSGAPAPAGLDTLAHAGTLGFELSIGRERMIVNCGSWRGNDAALACTWRETGRMTAAHSALVVDDVNLAELAPGGGLGRRPQSVSCYRQEAGGEFLIDASHDGYATGRGLVHRRRLYLTADGGNLRGEDTLTGKGGNGFHIRFHLHPGVRVSKVRGKDSAVVRLGSGDVWRFHAAGAVLAVEDSIYLGWAGVVQPTRQIVLSGPLRGDGAQVKWALRHEK